MLKVEVEGRPTETVNPRREIGPGSVQVTEQLIRFGLDGDRQFLVVQCPTRQGCYSCARHRNDRAHDASGFASVRIASASGNSRKISDNSGGAALGGPNQDFASSVAAPVVPSTARALLRRRLR